MERKDIVAYVSAWRASYAAALFRQKRPRSGGKFPAFLSHLLVGPVLQLLK